MKTELTSHVLLIITLLLSHVSLNSCKSVTPPRGWNSWVCYKGCVNETQFIQNAEAVVKYLKPFGYEYVVTDGGWSSHVDQYGRPQPNITKYPHSANGTGFKWLSAQIHSMGLKFGVWVGRGITQQAITANTPVYGTNDEIHAQDIYNKSQQCPWAHELFGVDFSKNGSAQFINSLYSQFAEWGIDFIKNDCVFENNLVPHQIELVNDAMDNVYKTMNGYEFIYSLSPGDYTPPQTYNNISSITSMTNMYRITGDCWDRWTQDILPHFNVTAQWVEYIGGKGRNDGLSYPDLDLMPLGYIADRQGSNCEPHRWTSLTYSQQRVLFTLWSIARSPLMFSGAVTKLENDTFTRNLITNQYLLDVNFNSSRNRQVNGTYDKNGYPIQVIWSADGVNNDFAVAFFNVAVDNTKAMFMEVSFKAIGGQIVQYTKCEYVEAWTNKTGTMTQSVVQATVNSNDTAFFYLHSCS